MELAMVAAIVPPIETQSQEAITTIMGLLPSEELEE